MNALSLVDADSYWVDGYFEETTLASIRTGDPVEYGSGLAGVVVYAQHVGAVGGVAVAGGARYAPQDSNAKDWKKDGPIVQAQKIG